MSPEHTRSLESPDGHESGPTVLHAQAPTPYGIPPGTLLVNTYRVERLLGGGGMGEVYLARHTGLGTEHAIKVIRPAMASNGQVMDLFYREARVLRGVRHDAVVNYDGFVRDDQGRDYLVMEYVEGPSLADRLKRGPLTPAQVLALRDRLCAGLAEAHRKGAVHRDLSPDNAVLPGDRLESAKLIDFGLCKLLDPAQETIVGSSFAGKYRYASPEQLGLYGGTVDARSDIYSLGLILAAAARGRALDMGESFVGAVESRQRVPDLDRIAPVLRDWLTAMLQPDPAARPASIDDLLLRWPAATVLAAKSQPGEGGGDGASGADRSGERPGDRPKVRSEVRSGAGAARRRWLPLALGALLLAGAGVGLWRLLQPLETPGADTRPAARSPTPPPPATSGDAGGGRPVATGPSGVASGPGSDGPAAPAPVPAPIPADSPAAGDLDGLLAAGRLDDAFALVQSRIAAGQAPPARQTWALAERLRAAAKPDPAFALVRALAAGGYGPAAFALAELYDPLHWSRSGSPFSKPNPEKARDWYLRAQALGVPEAASRLAALPAPGGRP